ncbi:phospholipase [Agrobacterium salinitolerans]|nr:phospholipase [Agrobacterium salinitolerans]
MKLIMNGSNGEYIRNVLEAIDSQVSATHSGCERVDAAVAYVSSEDLLFNWCLKRSIPLRFWGRFDAGIPVSIHILEKFLKIRSPNYTCRLLRHFHAKVIWWRGVGAYIGSANLSQKAWFNNFEAGVFISEDELSSTGQAVELETFFNDINSRSSPLTDELYELCRTRAAVLEQHDQRDQVAKSKFERTDLVNPWSGLGFTSRKSAVDLQRTAFLNEWHSTLQILRNLATKVSTDEHRPKWVDAAAPWGAQADQFLHAHYYQRTFDGRRADYETHYTRHLNNPAHAELEALRWWKSLVSAPNNEDHTLNTAAPLLRNLLSETRILTLTEEEVVTVISSIHAAIEYARRVSNLTVGLAHGATYTIPEKVEALAKTIYRRRQPGRLGLTQTWHYVLYGGPNPETPDRIWEALRDPKLKIENFGISAWGELVGWANPDKFPPRNGRTSKALRSLGHNVTVHV